MNKWVVGFLAAVTLTMGAGLKRIHDVIKKEEASAPAEIQTTISRENNTSAQVLINRKAIGNWLEARGIEAGLPKNDRVVVCSGYGCLFKTKYKITESAYNQIKTILDSSTNPEEERTNLKLAIDFLKKDAGVKTGTANDRPGEPFLGNGQQGQMSELDETNNTLQYLYVLADKGYIRFHHLEAPAIANYIVGTTNIIVDKDTGKSYAVGYDKDGKTAITER